MFKLALALFMSAVLASNTAQDIKGKEFDNTPVPKGTVGARYIPAEDKRIKTRIQLDEGKYDYDLFGRSDFEYFPLQLGNGSYKVYIFENISGAKYRIVKSQDLAVEIKDPLSVFLASIQTVNWGPETETVKKAAELTKGLKTDKEKIAAIYDFVVKTISYDYDKIKNIDTTYVPNPDKILEEGKGICYDYSAVFASMLRSQGIPSKLIKGYSTLVKGYHAWNEVYLADEERWMIIDTTYDSVVMRSGKKTQMEKKASQYTKSKEY